VIASKRKTAPTDGAITLAEAKKQLNIDDLFTADDTLITTNIKAACAFYEKRTGRQLMQANWQLVLDDWRYDSYECLELPVGPVVSIVNIQYYRSSDNTLQTLADTEYRLNNFHVPAQVELFGTLPDVYDRTDAVIIEYIAGHGAAAANEAAQQAAIEEDDKMILKTLLTDFYEFRGENVLGSVSSISRKVDMLLQERKIHTKTFFEHA
jgi:uncharacterized phiE125 gp8 family phage protein